MIRNANSSDLPQLLTLYNALKVNKAQLGNFSYVADIQQRGFLLGTDDPHSMADEISDAYDFIVFERNGQILGYIVADHRTEQRFYDDEYKTWFDLKLKDIYYQNPNVMSLSTIAVHPEAVRSGVATRLLAELEKKLSAKHFTHLFSIITIAPLTNCASILWHTKHGFSRLAMGRPRTLFGFDNFASILVYKKLSD